MARIGVALPWQPARLVGRDAELAAARARLDDPDVRLLTLVGPPGVGKTRLAVAVAREVAGAFDDVAFVDLASLSDPALLLDAVAAGLGVADGSGRPAAARLAGAIAERRLLLLLDNLEHLLDGAPAVADLLAACPRLTVLATSRAPLGLRWEHRFFVEPLGDADARALFVERARRVLPAFAPTAEEEALVARICARLDGLPLALELAAARVGAVSLVGMLERLARGLGVLAGGPRDLPARQRTLRDALAWSVALLSPAERATFRRLAVFPAGCTPEAARAVLADASLADEAVDDALGALVEASLLHRETAWGDGRFRMLETVRAYAAERLAAEEEPVVVWRRQATYYAELAEGAAPFLKGGGRGAWLSRLDRELDNIRATLAWCRDDPGAIEQGLRLAGALEWYWHFRDYWREGFQWLESLLARPGPQPPGRVRARALYAAGRLAVFLPQHRPAHARARLEEGLALFRACGDAGGQAYALAYLARLARIGRDRPAEYRSATAAVALATESGDRWGTALALYYRATGAHATGRIEEALAACEEGAALFRECGDDWGVALLAEVRLHIALRRGDLAGARAVAEEALALRRADGEPFALAASLAQLGSVLRMEGDYARAAALLTEALALVRAIGHAPGVRDWCRALGFVALEKGDIAQAAAWFRESLAIARDLGQELGSVLAIVGLAGAAGLSGRPTRARRLADAAADLLAAGGWALGPIERDELERGLAHARRRATGTSAATGGRRLSLEEATAEALRPDERERSASAGGPLAPPGGLTRRELDVLRLLAAGASNKEIAAALVLSHRTVERHIAGIYRKIGARRRGDAVAYALRHRLEPALAPAPH